MFRGSLQAFSLAMYPNILRSYLPHDEGGTRDATNDYPVTAFVQCSSGWNCPIFFRGISVGTMMWKGVKKMCNPGRLFRQSKWPFAKSRSSPSCSFLSSVVANSLRSWQVWRAGICVIYIDFLINIPYKLHASTHTYMHVYGQFMNMGLNMKINMYTEYIYILRSYIV